VYACVYGGDIYRLTGGAGDFLALSQTARAWYGMAAAPNGDVYACVYSGDIYRRIVAKQRFIEYLDPDTVVADSFVHYQGAAATVITGLDHLEGEEVDVVADGFVVTGHVVAGGQITLATAASDVYVGLHYETTIEPEPPDYIDDKGRNNINTQKQWAEVILRLYETGLSGVTVNDKSLPASAGTALFTGDVRTPLLGTTRAGILTIQQTLPLPFTLLAVTGTLDMGD